MATFGNTGMRTAREPTSEPKANQRSSMRGVRLIERVGRPNPHGVQWAERQWDASKGKDVRKVRTQFFDSADARDRKASSLRDARRKGLGLVPARADIEEWRAFKAAIGDAPWQEVVRVWHANRVSTGTIDSKFTVAEWATAYLARAKQRADRGELALNTYRHHRHKIGLFSEHFGASSLNRVTTDDIRAWLDGIGYENAGTFNNYRKIVAALFADAIFHGHLSSNPVDRVKPRKIVGKEVGILTVPQIAKLFHTAATVPRYTVCLRRLALETFAGVRFSSACRLKVSDVNMTDRGIRHPAASIKTQKRQYVEGFPDNLWEWLKIAPGDETLTERQYLQLKSELFIRANVPHPRNCLRHSFPTYHLASRQNPGATAYLMCHRNQQKLWDHYKGNATASEGRRFESLTPLTVAVVAKELEAVAPQV